MHTPTFGFRTTMLPEGVSTLSWFVQPGYIVLDLSAEDLDDPDERQFMVLAEERVGSKLRGAILALGIEGYGFVPSLRFVTYEDAELATIEVDGPSAYVAKVVAATQQLGLKNLRA